MDGNTEKALVLLDKEKEITISQTIVISAFVAMTVSELINLAAFGGMVFTDGIIINKLYFMNEFFLLDPILRLIFSCAFIGLAAGVLIKWW